MKTINFTSALRNEMAHFVKLKQSLGSDYYHNAQLLYRFDQYLDSVSFDDTILTLPVFQHYKSSTANKLNEYIQRYQSIMPCNEQSPLFINNRRKPLKYGSVCDAFHKTIERSCIGKDKKGPRLYSFRHSFAVHRLLHWYKTEQDINAKLPFLSTYMGHVDITSTQVYLEATSELLQAGCERFYTFFLKHNKGDNK
jgi:integrase